MKHNFPEDVSIACTHIHNLKEGKEILHLADPVVFEYCKNNICRIVTKWGTEDDQAYLDPLLTNEIEN